MKCNYILPSGKKCSNNVKSGNGDKCHIPKHAKEMRSTIKNITKTVNQHNQGVLL